MKANWIEFIVGLKSSDKIIFKGVSNPFHRGTKILVKEHDLFVKPDLMDIKSNENFLGKELLNDIKI